MAVLESYDRFLSYIKEQDLQDVFELKPLANGGEIVKALGCKTGPWMSKALDMSIKWQLLHPEVTDKEQVLEELSRRKEELGIST